MTELKEVSEGVRRKIEDKTGEYNAFPPNWHEITESDFVKSMFFIYSPRYYETRQMHYPYGAGWESADKTKPYTAARIFHMHDGNGYGIVRDWQNGKLHFFRFITCEHKFKLTKSRMCYREYKCEKCGYEYAEDSSD